MPRTPFLAFVLVASSCLSAAQPAGGPDPRADEAGLSGPQTDSLRALGFPVLVPVLEEGWHLDTFVGYGGGVPGYHLHYGDDAGRCFALEGTASSDGWNTPDMPRNERAVAIAALPAYEPHRLYWVTDDPDDLAMWGAGVVTTDFLMADGMGIQFSSFGNEDCTGLSVDDAEAVLGRLRFLDPADDRTETYQVLYDLPFVPDDVPNDPESLARAAFGTEGATGDAVTVEVLRRTPLRAVVLVTSHGLPGGAAQDERVRAVYATYEPGESKPPVWYLVEASSQARCRPGHGPADWGPDSCE